MTVLQTLAEMVGHVRMESTTTRVLVPRATLGTTVQQVNL